MMTATTTATTTTAPATTTTSPATATTSAPGPGHAQGHTRGHG
jgi:hypothetical protein